MEQPKTGLLAKETAIGWGWGLYVATFPAGTLCRLASNLPADKDGKMAYWIEGNPISFCSDSQTVSKDDFESWKETYGFRVSHDEVVGRKPVVRKKKI